MAARFPCRRKPAEREGAGDSDGWSPGTSTESNVIPQDPYRVDRRRLYRAYGHCLSLACETGAGLPFDLHAVGRPNHVEKLRLGILREDLDVGHYTVSANDS